MKFQMKLLILILLTLLLIGLLAFCVYLDGITAPEKELPASNTTVATTGTAPPDEIDSIPEETTAPTETIAPTIAETQFPEPTNETVPKATEAPKKPSSGPNTGNQTPSGRPPVATTPTATEPTSTQGTLPPTPPTENEDNGGEWGGGDVEL